MTGALAFFPDGGNGGPEFRREATRYDAWFRRAFPNDSLDVRAFPHRAPVVYRCQAIVDLIEAARPASVAFLCHGFEQRIQPGFERGAQFRALAHALGDAGTMRVQLWCCSTGGGPGVGGDGGFADRLRDAAEVEVFAHVGPGHVTRRPYIRYFAHHPGTGGEWLTPPPGEPGHDPATWARLRKLLTTDFRFAVSELTLDEARARLRP